MKKLLALIEKNSSQLFIVSLFSLFLELIIIRWLSSEIRAFGFLKNIPLIISFLGMGLGSMSKKPKISTKKYLLFLIALFSVILATARYTGLSGITIPTRDDLWIWWSSESFLDKLIRSSFAQYFAVFSVYSFFVIIFLGLVFAMFFGVGELLGEKISKLKPIVAYKINLFGSIAGVILFTVISFLYAPPLIWFLISYILIGLIQPIKLKEISIIAISLVFIILGNINVYWSPYYRIEINKISEKQTPSETATVNLGVNHVYFQQMANLSENYLQKSTNEELHKISVNYNLPYELIKKPGKVLIVGAGAGNDAASALRHGAERVDAVDIDPVILSLGKLYHPENPYNNDKVNLIVDDARSFFEKSDEKYDTIVFGLLDSHTSVSTFSNVRLDNFVYTRESFQAAKKHLKDGGNVILSHAGGKPWLLSRLAFLMESSFGQKPLAFRRHIGADGGIFIISNNIDVNILNSPEINKLRVEIPTNLDNSITPTDDWPYLYLKNKSIPGLYLATLSLVIILFIVLVMMFFDKKEAKNMLFLKKEGWHFFFLGSAFLLIEVKSINQLSLLFGSTWIVNSAVIFSILLLAYIANTLVEKNISPNHKVTIIGLFLSLLISFSLNISNFSGNSFIYKFAIAAPLILLPLFFSGLIFSNSFKLTKEPAKAYGANLFGSFLGGISENIGMITGIRFLTILAAVFYLIAVRIIPKK